MVRTGWWVTDPVSEAVEGEPVDWVLYAGVALPLPLGVDDAPPGLTDKTVEVLLFLGAALTLPR